VTPIHPKDRPKVIAMSVLSVLMLGFFLMTVMGAISKKPGNAGNPPPLALADAPPPAVSAGPAVTASVAPPVKSLSTADADKVAVETTPVNPFRHVLPDPFTLQRMIAEANAPPTPKRSPPPLSGSLPGGAIGGIGSSVAIAPVVPPAPMIRLDGVVTDRDHYAMVTFNDRTDMYHVGGKVGGLITVIGVTDSGASFRGPKGIFRLEVGDERNAAAPTPKIPSSTDKSAKHEKPSSRNEARPHDVAEYATLPLPSMEGPASGRGH
jgi:hypothetical protein